MTASKQANKRTNDMWSENESHQLQGTLFLGVTKLLYS